MSIFYGGPGNSMDEHKHYTILTCYYRPKPGGFCKRLFRAINALLDHGQTVHYLAVVPFPIDHPNCHFHRFPWPLEKTSGYLFWGVFHLCAPVQLLYIAVRYRVDSLFAFGHNYALLLQPARIARRIPLTLFLRADTIENHRIKGRSSLLVALEHLLEGLGIAGTRMYGVSATLTSKILARHKFLKPAKHGVLRNDIPACKTVQRRSEQIHLPLRLACVGVLEPRKNQRLLLEVMKEMPADKAQLFLYGTGPDEDLLRTLVKQYNIGDRVHFMGWVESERIWPKVDLLLIPSLHEGAPNAVLEALGHGVPVLASDIPEHREILPEKQCLPLASHEIWKHSLLEMFAHDSNQLMSIYIEQREIVANLFFDWNNTIIRSIS